MSAIKEEYAVVLTTAGSEEQATTIARGLVERRLAACVNIVGPMCSIYRWDGKICEEGEKLLVIKTRPRLFDRVTEAIGELHTYEVPEVVMLPLSAVSASYGAWLAANLESADD